MNMIKWLGVVGILVTAYLASNNIFPENIVVGGIATSMLGYVSFHQKDYAYLALNCAIMAIYGVGFANYFLN